MNNIYTLLTSFPFRSLSYSYNTSVGNNYGVSSSIFYSHALLLQDAKAFSPELAKVSIALATSAHSDYQINTLLTDMGFDPYAVESNLAVYNRSRSGLTMKENDYVSYTIGRTNLTHPITGETYVIYCVPIQGTPKKRGMIQRF